jgi:hypothetical protein
VIIADPFFRDRSTNLRAAQYGWRAIPEAYDYAQKRLFIRAGLSVCRSLPSLCPSAKPIVYRSKENGMWQTFGFDLTARYPVTRRALTNYTASMAAADVGFAERFLAATGVRRTCVVLSAPPSASVNANACVEEIGRLLDVRVSLPSLERLMTFDGSHVTPESAERWSAALLAEIDDAISRCAGD